MYPTPCWDLQEFRFVAASALKLFLSLCLETAEDYSGKYVLEGQLPWDAKQRDDELRKWPRCENPLSMGWFHLLERSKRDFSRYWLVIFHTISLLLPDRAARLHFPPSLAVGYMRVQATWFHWCQYIQAIRLQLGSCDRLSTLASVSLLLAEAASKWSQTDLQIPFPNVSRSEWAHSTS